MGAECLNGAGKTEYTHLGYDKAVTRVLRPSLPSRH